MAYFDDKQKKLINSWHTLAAKSKDAYMAFMAEWIAFNAICYNLYYEKATIERANIDRKKSNLNSIHEKFNPNADVDYNEKKIENFVTLRAIKDIKAGEEIIYNYEFDNNKEEFLKLG